MTTTPNKSPYSPLLEDEDLAAPGKPGPQKPRRDRRLDDALRLRLRRWWNNPKKRRALLVAMTLLILGGGISAYFAFRPVPKPDFSTANVDVLFNYTLLTEEFNKLPIQERLDLIAQLVERLKSLDGDQSLLMAAFAAQIQGQVREQFERNASLLAIDLFDSYAQDYSTSMPKDQRDQLAEAKFIEFQKTLERVAGEERDLSDEERLIEGRKQARRDLEFARSGELPVGNAVRMLTFVNRSVGSQASGHQKIRLNAFVSQMVRTLREGEVPPEEQPEPPVEDFEPEDPAMNESEDGAGETPDIPPVQPEQIAPTRDQTESEESASNPEHDSPAENTTDKEDDDDGGTP